MVSATQYSFGSIISGGVSIRRSREQQSRREAVDLAAQEFRINKKKMKPAQFQENKSLLNYEDMF